MYVPIYIYLLSTSILKHVLCLVRLSPPTNCFQCYVLPVGNAKLLEKRIFALRDRDVSDVAQADLSMYSYVLQPSPTRITGSRFLLISLKFTVLRKSVRWIFFDRVLYSSTSKMQTQMFELCNCYPMWTSFLFYTSFSLYSFKTSFSSTRQRYFVDFFFFNF